MATPILKWAGGKRQILSNILRYIPSNYEDIRFHEPMFGGGAFTFEIEPNNGTINDVNSRLIRFYRVVKNYPEQLIDENRKHSEHITRKYFNTKRRKLNNMSPTTKEEKIEEASLLLYLNRTCFNGLYRENSDGEFNVPFGDYKNPDVIRQNQILECSKILKNLEIYQKDFEYVINVTKPGDIVYFDPPYHPTSDTAYFTRYSDDNFDIKDQKRLKNIFFELDQMGVNVIMSNSNTMEIRNFFNNNKNIHINEISVNRGISCKSETRGEVKEIIITNVPKERWRDIENY